MTNDLAERLRHLRTENGWTTMDMAYRSKLPKRTLEKYMLRTEASLPGFDALIAMSKGFGVSLDWLVFGAETSGETVDLLVRRCAHDASLKVFDALLRYHLAGQKVFDGEEILNLTVEQWAAQIAESASEKATELSEKGFTKEALLNWEFAMQERLGEVLRDKFNSMVNEPIGKDG